MRSNVAILTETGRAVSHKAIVDYAAGVFAHISHDFGQHTQMKVYPYPFEYSDVSTTPVIHLDFYRKWKIVGDSIVFDAASYVTSTFYSTLDTLSHWHPFGLGAFAVKITGGVIVPTAGTYKFQLATDDGGYLFIDGVLQIKLPGAHSPENKSKNVTLTAGLHSIEIQYWQNGDGHSGWRLRLPVGVTLAYIESSNRTISTDSMRMLVTDDSDVDVAVVVPVFQQEANTIDSPPVIVRQPQDILIALTGTAQFSVSAISDTPITYQWRKNDINITGQTMSRLTLLNIAKTDSANYSCVATNISGSTTSREAALSVGPKPAANVINPDDFNFNPLNPLDPFGFFS